MYIFSKSFGRRHEPPRHKAKDSFQESEPYPLVASQSESYPSMINANIEWKDTPEAHVYKVHLQGMNNNDVKVEVDEGERVICIIGEKKVKKQEHRGGLHHVEFSSGTFVQRLTLPENSMVDHVRAHMDNGVLTIMVPKHRVMNNNNRVRNINIYEH
ncbi:hypothetical protein Lal_00038325 [Lupinus albus]|uniref:Putative small heat shock protein HSP20 n=1 Tax=Lupinus albus TaxID=3870 RepID=A0A6A5NKU6_LUPAL|nr:putative small heat shock protein HSP20 [Lupinus albus]KAF1883833.1 hypothetical protein Lal_00038325 [Lupinus albus]